MNWKIGEERAANWFKENYDAEAIHLGGSNSNMPDIISKIYGKIEVKGPKAQCGQFTRSKIKNNEYNQYIASKNRKEVTEEEATNWCRNFYKEKDINYFITYDNNYNCQFMTRDEFFNTHTCQMELRESKMSGSGPLPKIYYNQIPKEWNYQIKNGKPYVSDKTLWDTEYVFTGRNGKQYRMSPSSKTFGEIRKLSNTKNETWIFSVK